MFAQHPISLLQSIYMYITCYTQIQAHSYFVQKLSMRQTNKSMSNNISNSVSILLRKGGKNMLVQCRNEFFVHSLFTKKGTVKGR